MSMITGQQIRSARAALRLSVQDLASLAGVGEKTIRRLEEVDGIPEATVRTLAKVYDALGTAGIQFIGTPDDNPGIRVTTPKA